MSPDALDPAHRPRPGGPPLRPVRDNAPAARALPAPEPLARRGQPGATGRPAGDHLDRIALGVRLPGGVVHRAAPDGTPRCPARNPFRQAWMRTTAPVTCRDPGCTADG